MEALLVGYSSLVSDGCFFHPRMLLLLSFLPRTLHSFHRRHRFRRFSLPRGLHRPLRRLNHPSHHRHKQTLIHSLTLPHALRQLPPRRSHRRLPRLVRPLLRRPLLGPLRLPEPQRYQIKTLFIKAATNENLLEKITSV